MVVVLIVKHSRQENLNSTYKNILNKIKIKRNQLQNDMNLYHQLDEETPP
jgi:hypothetical protein